MTYETNPTASYLVRALLSNLGKNPEGQSTDGTIKQLLELLVEELSPEMKKQIKSESRKYIKFFLTKK